MKRLPVWLALPAITSLVIARTTVVHAAVGDTVQTTGGGWIQPSVVSTPTSSTTPRLVRTAASNTKATFGFVASATVQADNTLGDFQGELSYHDHGVGLRLHSLSITKVTVGPAPHMMTFAGTADVTTAAGSAPQDFIVTVQDNGEPGVGVDTFDIQIPSFLPSPYHAFGLLGGGNIQVRP